MNKLLMLVITGLFSLGLAGFLPGQPSGGPDDPPPPEKKEKDKKDKEKKDKKKADGGPEGELRRAYDLLRRIKSEEGASARPDERLRDWTERAAKYYRKAVQAETSGDHRVAHEYGLAAHDLARAVDHSRNASRFDRPDADLPPPPDGPDSEAEGERARRDLRHAYDRIRDFEDIDGPEGKFYLDAARDLYNAARRDAQGGRQERAGELARAAEALTHVPEHLSLAAGPDPKPGRPEKPEPKARKKADEADSLPPLLPPRD